jgi:hypothetical protein
MKTGLAFAATIGPFLLSVVSLNAEAQTSPAAQSEGVYVVAYRAPNHIKASSPQVFHGFADDLIGYLKSREVNIFEDPERGILQTDELISVDSLLNLTKNAGAKYLLLATVDRPPTKWLKVTVQAYDLSGKVLWVEEASAGSGMTGGGAPGKVLKTLQKKLDPRIAQPGLPKKLPAPSGAPLKADARIISVANK